MPSFAEALAVARVWRLTAMMTVAVGVVVVSEFFAPVSTIVPGIDEDVPLLDMLAVLVGMVLPVGLIDQMPLWAALSGRVQGTLRAGRFAAAALPLTVVLIGWTVTHHAAARSWWVTAFFALGCLAVPAIGTWFWVPVFVAGYAWFQVGHSTTLLDADPWVPVVGAFALSTAALAAYVVGPGCVRGPRRRRSCRCSETRQDR